MEQCCVGQADIDSCRPLQSVTKWSPQPIPAWDGAVLKDTAVRFLGFFQLASDVVAGFLLVLIDYFLNR